MHSAASAWAFELAARDLEYGVRGVSEMELDAERRLRGEGDGDA